MTAGWRRYLRMALRTSGLYPNARVNRVVRTRLPYVYKRLTGTPPEWAIALLEGPSPFDLRPARAADPTVLTRHDVTDVRAHFVADPFAITIDDVWHLFFEVLNADTGKGEIALATSSDLRTWRYDGIVLDEPFHLSYPLVFEWDGELYMIPESWEAGSVRLYRASASVRSWSFVDVLLQGPVLLDSTVFRHDGSWWMFTETNEQHAYDTLRLFVAADLRGPWHEHPSSPIVRGDARWARPAGGVVVGDGIIRYTQDCQGGYGRRVRAFEIFELTKQRYAERPVDLDIRIGPDTGWNVRAVHHVDPHPVADGRWLAFIDGY